MAYKVMMTDHVQDIIHARFEDCKAFVKVEQARLMEQRVEQVIMSLVDDLAQSFEAPFLERIRTQLLPQISSISQECLEEAVRTSIETPTNPSPELESNTPAPSSSSEEERSATNKEPITHVTNESPSEQVTNIPQGSSLSGESLMANNQLLFDFELNSSLSSSSPGPTEAPNNMWEYGGASFPAAASLLEGQFDHGHHPREQGFGQGQRQGQEEGEPSFSGVNDLEDDDFDSFVFNPIEKSSNPDAMRFMHIE
jgi:hypothetical protein